MNIPQRWLVLQKQIILHRNKIILFLGIICSIFTIVAMLWERSRTDKEMLQDGEYNISQTFQQVVATLKSPKYDVYRISYDSLYRLKDWEKTGNLPDYEVLRNPSLSFPNKEDIFQYKNKIFYYIQKDTTHGLIVYLIPLSIRYENENSVLKPYLFLGNYNGTDADFVHTKIYDTKPENEESYLTIRAKNGKAVFYIGGLDAIFFRQPARIYVFSLGIFAVFGLLYSINQYFLTRFTREKWKAHLIFLLLVIMIRTGVGYIGFPYSYIPFHLFSANTIAFHVLVPSLGDFMLNVVLLTSALWVFFRHNYFIRIEELYKKIPKNRILHWAIIGANLGLSLKLIDIYGAVFQELSQNSQILMEFSNIFRNDFYAYILLAVVGYMLLGGIYLIMCLLKWNVLAWENSNRKRQMIVFQTLMLIAIAYINYQGKFTCIFTGVGALFLLGIAIMRRPDNRIIHYDLLNFIPFIASLSLIITHNVVESNMFRLEKGAEDVVENSIKKRASNIAYEYNHAFHDMEDNPLILKHALDSLKNTPDVFLALLKERYFYPNIRVNSMEIYLYHDNDLIASTSNNEPVINYSKKNLKEIGKEIEHGLYQIPNYEDRYDDIFVGQFFFENFGFDSVTCNIEILPSRLDLEMLYPALLLEEQSFRSSKQLEDYEIGYYRSEKLHSNLGKSTFPLYIPQMPNLYSKPHTLYNEQYIDKIFPLEDKQRIVMVRYTRPSLYDHVNTFSFIFIFFAIGTLLGLLVHVLYYIWINEIYPFRTSSLQSRLQWILLATSIVPLAVITIILVSFIQERFKQQTATALKKETQHVADAITQDYLALQNLPLDNSMQRKLLGFQKKVLSLGTLLNTDINIYDAKGKLFMTTQPTIAESGTTSDIMNPIAYQKLTLHKAAQNVQDERLGEVRYSSCYKPIFVNKPIGFVNIMYLTKQEEVDERVFDLLGYIANIYLLLLIGCGLLTIVISKNFTRPLQLIQERLAKTKLGEENPPIDYESKDEIGAIVTAYNRMLEILEENKKQLAKQQRDFAWQEMARQVAHEIKNPLTPMKLKLQMLLRAWDNQAPNLQKMFPDVANTILSQIDSLTRIADNFSQFAKMPEGEKKYFSLNEVLRELEALYGSTDTVNFSVNMPELSGYVYADRDQLSRVLTNLVKNAFQAIEAKEAKDEMGELLLNMMIDDSKVYIEIRDSGIGMSEEVQARAFEPNFSTKTSGMGLGLAIVKRIIESSQGDIRFESTLGKGTTFYIELPRALNAQGESHS